MQGILRNGLAGMRRMWRGFEIVGEGGGWEECGELMFTAKVKFCVVTGWVW